VKVLGIIGSPKSSGGMSAALLDAAFSHLEGAQTERVVSSGLDADNAPDAAADAATRMMDADAVALSFPLYVDGLPSHLLRLLEAVGAELRQRAGADDRNTGSGDGTADERAADKGKPGRICEAANGGKSHGVPETGDEAAAKNPPTVYVIVNCGFFEPEHTELVIEQVRLWCGMSGLPFGRALALGGGGVGGRFDVGRGPLRRAGQAVKSFAGSILALESGDTIFVKIDIPRFLYIFGGHRSWTAAAKRRGLTKNDMRARPTVD
jgi:putative NADPH-quinone reductase